ncbi:MAG: TraB/GumN family protein [Bacteroidales bacterium]|nr:TraB/GumN family protein [Bacteroidales bacterium]
MSYSQKNSTNAQKELLWEISGNGLTEKSYLFGTWHGTAGIGTDFLDSIPGFHKSFESVTQYVGENTAEENILEVMDSFLGEKWMPKDVKYEDLLDQNDIQFLDSLLLKYIGTTSSEMNIRPIYMFHLLSSILSIKPYLEAENEKCRIMMDSYLLQEAKKKNYAVHGLDNTEEIFNRMAREFYFKNYDPEMTLKESADYIIRELKVSLSQEENEDLNAIMKKMENAYRNRNLEDIVKYKNESNQIIRKLESNEVDFDKSYHFLTVGRNKLWMKRIPELITNSPSFIAVGALHLHGKEGLIELLKNKGYKLTPINQ